MSPFRSLAVLALAVALVSGPSARAQDQTAAPAGSELGQIRQDFEYGKYREVLQRARNLLDRGGLGDEQLAELHRLAGVAAFNLGQSADAERHLATLLRIDPDATLDPFLFPPPAVQFLEKLRKAMASDLEVIRQERRIQADRRQREEEDRARAKRQAEELQRKLDELTRRVTVRTVEKRIFLVNFVPFGAGQFQQNRSDVGLLLAVTEGALAATSVLAYFAYGSLFRDYTLHVPNVLNPDGSGYLTVTYRAIPTNRRSEADVWRVGQYGAAIGFYLLYGYGVVDAILNHEDQVITTSVEEREPEPAAPERHPPLSPSISAHLAPLPGGLGASLRVDF